MWKKVSFSFISKHHVTELFKYFKVYEIDEHILRHFSPHRRGLLILHPFFYTMINLSKRLERIFTRLAGIVGIDVADSDKLSELAVSMSNYADMMIVPSCYARESYTSSGVLSDVQVLPHGLSSEYFAPKCEVVNFHDLYKLKRRHDYVYLLHYCWHSGFRKGLDLVYHVYRRIREVKRNVILIEKADPAVELYARKLKDLGCVFVSGWLNERQKLELYDLCDIYLGFSRGGGFEMNYLEALVRGEVVIAPDRGAWVDYLPDFCLVKSKTSEYVLKDNPIHVGKGVEIDVNKAVRRILNVVGDLEEWKMRIMDYVIDEIRHNYTWENVGMRFKNILNDFLSERLYVLR